MNLILAEYLSIANYLPLVFHNSARRNDLPPGAAHRSNTFCPGSGLANLAASAALVS